MKKLTIILACFLVAMMSCTKSKEVHPEIGDGNDEIVTVGIKDVHVEYARTDHAELNRVVFHYCPADANGNAQQFAAAEMTKKEIFFELTLNDLLSDTLYWYYYELFPNSGDAFNTVQKTFHTQAYGTPEPPTPPTPPTPGNAPEGAIDGLFSVSPTQKVYFSKGNLQYQASTNTWRFAENQWDFVGDETRGSVYEDGVKCNNAFVSSTYSGWIDMFGWGTSGYNHGAICYQPWSISENFRDYYAYGSATSNLYEQTGRADWGYNAISNGGNQENMWRSLSNDEWTYLLTQRNTESGIRYAKAYLNSVAGLVLLPDNWEESIYGFSETNSPTALYNTNSISLTEWNNVLQPAGVVFLSAAGTRRGTVVSDRVEWGQYWTSSFNTNSLAYPVSFSDDHLDPPYGYDHRFNGQTVRLAQDANP